MTEKIFKSIFIVASAVLLACLIVVFGVLYNHFSNIEEDQLRTDMMLAKQGVETSGIKYLEELKDSDTRITWIAKDGKVIYDTVADAASMENHGKREEVKEAFKSGSGDSYRYSTTRTEKTLYYAKLLNDGTVLRMSKSHDSVLALVFGMIQPILFIVVLALIGSAIIAASLSKRIVEPLNNIALDRPMENQVYDELSPLLRTIAKQHRQIDSQFDELKRRKNEFNAVIGNMAEGLVLLGRDGRIISINRAAQIFFNTAEYCIGSDFITIERNKDVEDAVKTSLTGKNCELQISRENKEYQINVSKIENDDVITGVVILIFDITDKALAERNRREFTANVSHELKTPLQSIIGSAELIENGLVQDEDMPQFIGRIRSESARLVTLIEDIIYLSQLDEHTELVKEKVDLYGQAAHEIESLRLVAENKNISISLKGSNVVLDAVPQLVHETIYNLCDNAIKYNVDGGHVNVTVGSNETHGWVLVEDTGIGIAPEHLDRIFERFYRVDKSHSKETGGTGLGLSIVKHAVEYMKGEIKIESKENEGTSIKVLLPFSG